MAVLKVTVMLTLSVGRSLPSKLRQACSVVKVAKESGLCILYANGMRGLLSRREQQSHHQVPAIAKENAPTPKDERVFSAECAVRRSPWLPRIFAMA
jgi:hypothetical protein